MELQQKAEYRPLKPYMEQSRRTSMFHYKYLKKRGQPAQDYHFWLAEAS